MTENPNTAVNDSDKNTQTKTRKSSDQNAIAPSDKVNWKQAFATALTLGGTVIASVGMYISVRSIDKSYDVDNSLVRARHEAFVAVSKQSVDQYRNQISEVRKEIIDLESKIEKLDPEKIQKDEKSGVLLTGENLVLSKDIQAGLERLNKEVFRLPQDLATSVNQARSELFNRFQVKIFDKHYPNSSVNVHQENPFFIREFDAATEQQLKNMIRSEK